ncbi:MAG: beta-ketoacyl-ACP synthase [Deltaproteobacteria bacterium]|nr:beta-ketoacyl-ACP synthase [Deltaproteobacteria bacterium]MBN2673286.1 beta-ketoacyl-ACP synthase [Deltaproteobacteria bacterium]
MNRVVVTGMSGITSLGQDWASVREQLRAKKSGVRYMKEWKEIDGLTSFLGGPIDDFAVPSHYNRKHLRTMGRVAKLAIRSTELALIDASLLDSEALTDGTVGVSYGSTYGSSVDAIEFMKQVGVNKTLQGVKGSQFIKFMSHTCAANVSQFFKTKGRLIPACSACTSGSQAIGFGYEVVKAGIQDIMICGGAEELHPVGTSVFDVMYATSQRNDAPETTPRPFDKNRDGLVVGEGAGTLILESLESAKRRGASIYAELVGFGSNSDGAHMVNPSSEGMQRVMELALNDARLTPDDIDYVCAHGTSTEIGDIAESKATEGCFNRPIPINSLKSYLGHTLGACGAIEAWVVIHQMNEGWVAPTINLDEVDPNCGSLDYLTEVRELDQTHVMTNNFAFGGVNTSLIFKKWTE